MTTLKQNIILNDTRYRLYREHKYLFYVFYELLRLAATLDLSLEGSMEQLKEQVKKLEMLLRAHAEYEESRIHLALKNNHSPLFEEAENQHRDQHLFFENIYKKLNQNEGATEKDVHFLSYEIYLDLRNFISENLIHFDYEERIIMPEVQRLLTDDEIREIDRISYRKMSPEQMVHMMEVLFPHMNCEDKFTFLSEIKNCEPEKFTRAWEKIHIKIEEKERNHLIQLLNS